MNGLSALIESKSVIELNGAEIGKKQRMWCILSNLKTGFCLGMRKHNPLRSNAESYMCLFGRNGKIFINVLNDVLRAASHR